MSMSASAPALKLLPDFAPLLPRQPLILLIGDRPERLQRLRHALGHEQAEFIMVTTLAELPQRCGQSYALAILDFDPAQLPQALAVLRNSQATQAIPILVEAGRLVDAVTNATQHAGLLPKHRAMACHWPELLTLAQQQLHTPRRNTAPLRHLL